MDDNEEKNITNYFKQFKGPEEILNRESKTNLNMITKELRRKSILNSKMIGWNKTFGKWLYNPVQRRSEWKFSNSLIENMFVSDQREIRVEEEVFDKTLSMLELMDHSITLPLLAYTLLSLVKTHLYSEKIPPRFAMFLVGENNKIKKECLANLFGNLFHRSGRYIDTIRYPFHKRHDHSLFKIQNSIEKMRDCILILDFIKKKPNRNFNKVLNYVIRKYTDDDDNSSGGLLLGLSNKPIENIDIINIDIEGYVNESLLKQFIDRTYDLSTSIFLYLEKFEKKRLLKIKWAEEYQHAIEELNDINTDINIVEKFAYLLLGYKLYLDYGKRRGYLNNQAFADRLNQAIAIFKEACKKDEDPNPPIVVDLICEFQDYISHLQKENLIVDLKSSECKNTIAWYKKDTSEIRFIYLDFHKYYEDFTHHCLTKGIEINSDKRSLEKLLGQNNIISSQKSNLNRFDIERAISKKVFVKVLVVDYSKVKTE